MVVTDKSSPDMRTVLLLKWEHRVKQSLLWSCYYWWWLGQYAMSNGRNSIQLRYKLTPDPRQGSSVVMSDCNGHVRSAPSLCCQWNIRNSRSSVGSDVNEWYLRQNTRVIKTFQQRRRTAQAHQHAPEGGGTNDAFKYGRKYLDNLYNAWNTRRQTEDWNMKKIQ